MSKLLVLTPQNRKEVIEVGPGGGYFDKDRILWDEREHGPMTDEVKAQASPEVVRARPINIMDINLLPEPQKARIMEYLKSL